MDTITLYMKQYNIAMPNRGWILHFNLSHVGNIIELANQGATSTLYL